MNYNLVMDYPGLFEKKFSILQEISNAIAVTDNITAIANLMLDLAVDYTHAEKGSLMLVNGAGELSILAARGIEVQHFDSYRERIGEGIAGTVAKNRVPVLVKDIDQDETFRGKKRDRYKTGSFISCPIISKNKILGVFNINDKKDGSPFNEDEFALLQIIVNQAAIALENAFLMNQLRAKAAELEEMNQKLLESDVVKTEFLTRLSHELRTPLNSIKGSIYYLQQTEKLTPPELKEFYDIIANETGKLIAMAETQLDFLRLEDEGAVIKKHIIELPALLAEVINSKFLKTVLARKNLAVDFAISGNIADIVGDRIKISQCMINLIEGLSHFLEQNDSIRITASEDEFIRVMISLSRKMPETMIPDIANSRYLFQTDRSEDKLKLHLAWKVADSHRWKFEAVNRDDGFVLTLVIPKSERQKIDAVVTSTMEMFIDFIAEALNLNTCSIMLADDLTGELSIKSARGLNDDIVKRTRIKIGDSIAGWVALEGKPLLIEDIERDPHFRRRAIPQYNTKSLLSVPIRLDDKIIGVLNLNNKRSASSFNSRDLSMASAVSERISFFIKRLYSGNYREDDLKRLASSFDDLISAEKKYPKKGKIIPELTALILDRFGVDEQEKNRAIYVSMIYDLGLVLIDESVLMKKKKLLPSETNSVKVHPFTTVGLLDTFEFSEDVKKAILHHHERYDGTGYPDKLQGDAIPFLSRVLAVVDSFCAMVLEKPYRKALSEEEAIGEISKGAGSVYDPKVVEALRAVLSERPLQAA